MLLRNLDPQQQCNGSSLVAKKIMQHLTEATILSSCAKDIALITIIYIESN